MMKRRQFLSCVTAAATSYLLVGCGGGDSDGSAGAVNVQSAKAMAATSSVSANGTTVPPAPYIIDKSNIQWTLSNGYIYKNGVRDPSSYNVSLLLWYGSLVYQCGTGNQFYVWSPTGNWVKCADPRLTVAATAGMFYGMNGHFDYPFTPARVISTLRDLGCTTYRVDCANTSNYLGPVVALARAFQPVGMTLFPCILCGLYEANGVLYTSEQAAYDAAHANAAAIATALSPYGITMYECGNELTRDPAVIVSLTCAGNKTTDFRNNAWAVMRGAMRGMIDGVKSVQPTAKCGINFCAADIAAADMLWDGFQPDGSGGHPTVRWDITTWHNYQSYGDIFNIGTDGQSAGFNLPIYCKARYGVPFMITEWNTGPEQTETFRANYVTQQMGEFYASRKSAAIQSVIYYELCSGDTTYGITTNSLQPIQPTYNAFQSFVAGHLDN
ncbi:hypothetical protein WI80_00330 [Burkholderia ubonensis]|uniref:Asl1-like glycosyl hydrolase catalytic domain-containing protein n=2 Tax=Burkholderiaceae TaxID=119060 RepID=A0A105NXS4_9BURK|nr:MULTISPECIES: hypothetical protein [Burkholderia]KVD16127.1 hypothetical protein WI80_00330 [Burkholderia ubonensis]KVG69439.1 hypothetical protein WJ33_22520 [Burkholderia ubonensis]KVH78854.1 hypothetical protein WJ41_34345 [Burkholderia ubonensis]KVN88999.1 hypothetical protein WJ68_04830 [Burkholderia ubonensis]KVU05045.1 hypothetical protein WK61_32245 [Burkholderia ubonensis]